MLCNVYFSLAVLLGCGSEAPEPTPMPTPTVRERQAASTDRKSMWEWKYEQMCGCTFVRQPMTPEQIAARDAEDDTPQNGRFIFIPDR